MVIGIRAAFIEKRPVDIQAYKDLPLFVIWLFYNKINDIMKGTYLSKRSNWELFYTDLNLTHVVIEEEEYHHFIELLKSKEGYNFL